MGKIFLYIAGSVYHPTPVQPNKKVTVIAECWQHQQNKSSFTMTFQNLPTREKTIEPEIPNFLGTRPFFKTH